MSNEKITSKQWLFFNVYAPSFSIWITIFSLKWWLFIIMFPLPFIGLIGLIGGLVSLSVYLKIKKGLKEKRFYCYNCGYDITLTSKEGFLLCNSCGNKVLCCNFCSKIINPSDEVAVIKPCNHVFHKGELLDYVEDNYSCPKCQGEIKELAFKIEKDDKDFWVKAK
ncbi:MAG: hypothetical protein GPJ51_07150 [Candidatus Heimdallarchaeota archaeon]|nr:hypothetical protein [Candidatus Heimdallarchaeota archaeon]